MIYPEVNRRTRKLKTSRNRYNGQQVKPVKVPSYQYNLILLEEGLDVYWDNIEYDLRCNLDARNWQFVRLLLRSTFFKSSIILGYIPLCTPKDIIVRLVELNIKFVIFVLLHDDINLVNELISMGARAEVRIFKFKVPYYQIEYSQSEIEARTKRINSWMSIGADIKYI